MKKVVIVGGKLQGMEAAYLGRIAGMEIVLIDKDPSVPARDMAAKFICGDILSGDERIQKELDSADMVLPTMENYDVLKGLNEKADAEGFVLAFDWDAYRISCSKLASDTLFRTIGIDAPIYYPEGDAPYIVKPDEGSGSHGIQRLDNKKQVEDYLREKKESRYVVQEFVEGPSYSVEVIGRPGNYRTYVMTEIFVDRNYDCNLAAVYRNTPKEIDKKVAEMGVKIAEAMRLKGIMDLEVIDHKGRIKALEIDARIPSQTPIAVYYASGMNYMDELWDLFCKGTFQHMQKDAGAYSSVEHYLVNDSSFESLGERIMTEGETMRTEAGFCGAMDAITDHALSSDEWRAMFINRESSYESLQRKRRTLKSEIEMLAGEK